MSINLKWNLSGTWNIFLNLSFCTKSKFVWTCQFTSKGVFFCLHCVRNLVMRIWITWNLTWFVPKENLSNLSILYILSTCTNSPYDHLFWNQKYNFLMSRTPIMEQSNYKRIYWILEAPCKWNPRRRRLCLLWRIWWRLWLWWRSYSQFEHLEISDKLTRCKEDSNWTSLLSVQKQISNFKIFKFSSLDSWHNEDKRRLLLM